MIFVTAISEYDQMLFEDEKVNRLQESLRVFENIINNKFFKKSPIILFMVLLPPPCAAALVLVLIFLLLLCFLLSDRTRFVLCLRLPPSSAALHPLHCTCLRPLPCACAYA